MKSYINDAHGDPEELDSSILYFEGLRPPIDYSKKEIFLLNKANQLKNSHKYESGILNVFLSLLRLNPLPLKNKFLQKMASVNGYARNFKSKYGHIEIHDFRVNQIKHFFDINEIRLIYEFGSGASTYLFCDLLKKQFEKKGIKGQVISFDQSKKYQDNVIKEFPDELQDYVEFKYCRMKAVYRSDVRFLGYEIDYDQHVDLAYFDGPTPKLLSDENYSKQTFGHLNLLDMLEKNILKIGFTDKRQYYVCSLDSEFSDYKIRYISHLRSFEILKIP